MIDMSSLDLYQHNMRLNLNNPKHLKIHRKLLHFNKEVYKSKNDYIIKMLYEGMFGEDESMDKDFLSEIEERIVQRVTANLLRSLIGENGIKVPFDSTENKMGIDDEVADAAMGYFDDIDDWDDDSY